MPTFGIHGTNITKTFLKKKKCCWMTPTNPYKKFFLKTCSATCYSNRESVLVAWVWSERLMGENKVQKLIHTNVVTWFLAKVQKHGNGEGIVFLTSTADSI